MQRRALCRSRREFSNEYLLAKFGFDAAENEPPKVWVGRVLSARHFAQLSFRQQMLTHFIPSRSLCLLHTIADNLCTFIARQCSLEWRKLHRLSSILFVLIRPYSFRGGSIIAAMHRSGIEISIRQHNVLYGIYWNLDTILLHPILEKYGVAIRVTMLYQMFFLHAYVSTKWSTSYRENGREGRWSDG